MSLRFCIFIHGTIQIVPFIYGAVAGLPEDHRMVYGICHGLSCRNLGLVRHVHYQRTCKAHLFLQQTYCRIDRCEPQGIAAHEFCQVGVLVCRGEALGLHFIEEHSNAPVCSLSGRFATCRPSAYDGPQNRNKSINSRMFPRPHTSTSKGSRININDSL